MKIKHIDLGWEHRQKLTVPFNPNHLRVQFWQFRRADESTRRKHDEKVVVTVDMTPDEVVCAIQRMRRWLLDRREAAQTDFERGGYYNSGDKSRIYQSRED